ncbi:MAG: hypothetical protein PHU25_00205 [Deltaproteobacteria bacterium]|nr:hypothetical protein [Deltaproteobacteria bacterium]
MTSNHRCLNQIAIERYLLRELEGPAREAVEAAALECDACRAALAEARADEAAFPLRPVPEKVRALWIAPRRRPWARLVLVAAPVAVAAAVALAFVLPGLAGSGRGEYVAAFDKEARRTQTRVMGSASSLGRAQDGAAVRGGFRLGFYRQGARGGEMGESGDVLGAGDRIQFWYDAPRSAPAVLVGIDGRGAVTRYFPTDASGAVTLREGRGRLIDASVVLDDAPSFERFFLCVGDAAGDAQAVERAARSLAGRGPGALRTGTLPLPCEQATFWIRKR